MVNKTLYLTAALIVLCLVFVAVNGIGAVKIEFKEIIAIIASKVPVLGKGITGGWKETHETILVQVRLPRTLLAVLVGACLSVAGAIYQGIFKNPLADPYIIGASSGAALGAALAIFLSLNLSFLGIGAVSMLAFLTSILAVFLVYNMARVGHRVPVLTLLLAGIALSSFLSAVVSLLTYLSGDKLGHIIFWMMGSLSSRSWSYVYSTLVSFLAGILIAFYYARDLNILLLGEDTAVHLGIETERVKKILLATASILTAASVASSGLIGFVGLIIPHTVRIAVGPDHRWLIPASALTGGTFLLLADTIARTVFAPTELPVGIVTAMFGGPFFIYLLKKRKTSY